MSKHKLVPVEPIMRAIYALERFSNDTLAGRNSAHELRELLAAAPDVKGEPVAWVTADTVDGQAVNGKPRRVWWENNEGVGMPIYTAPQPATLRPIEEAPKDGTAILAWCVHEADPYYVDETGRLTAYGANAEGMAHVDDGWNLVHWQEGFFDGECHVPGWWTLADGYGETTANPVLWVPLPANPKPEDIPGTGNSLVVDDKVLSPASQGEPVAYISHTSEGDILGWDRQFDAPSHTPLYAAPQPAAQQLRKDSERLDWIESQAKKSPTGISFDYHKYVEDGYVLEHGFRFMRRHFASGFKDNIRKAIDAAMQELSHDNQ